MKNVQFGSHFQSLVHLAVAQLLSLGHMTRVELLTITDRFQIGRAGVVLRPDFSVPNGRWAARTEPVRIVTPDGQAFETPAAFNLSHFNIAMVVDNI